MLTVSPNFSNKMNKPAQQTVILLHRRIVKKTSIFSTEQTPYFHFSKMYMPPFHLSAIQGLQYKSVIITAHYSCSSIYALIVGLRWRPGTCHWGLTFQESTKVDKSNQGEEWDGHTELWLSHLPTTMIASLDVSGNPRRIVFSLLSCRLKSGGGDTLPKVGSLIRAENLFCNIILSLRHWLK